MRALGYSARTPANAKRVRTTSPSAPRRITSTRCGSRRMAHPRAIGPSIRRDGRPSPAVALHVHATSCCTRCWDCSRITRAASRLERCSASWRSSRPPASGCPRSGSCVLAILPAYASYALPTALLFGRAALVRPDVGGRRDRGDARERTSAPRGCCRPRLILGASSRRSRRCTCSSRSSRTRSGACAVLLRQLAGSVQVIEPGRFLEFGDRLLYVHALGSPSCPLEGVLIGSARPRASAASTPPHCGTADRRPRTATRSRSCCTTARSTSAIPTRRRYRRIKFETMKTAIDISRVHRPQARLDAAHLHGAARRVPLARDRRRSGVACRASTGPRSTCRSSGGSRSRCASLLLALVAVPLGIRPVRSGPLGRRADRDRGDGRSTGCSSRCGDTAATPRRGAGVARACGCPT